MIIALDPSINHCGFAIFSKAGGLLKYGTISPSREWTNWQAKAYSVLEKIKTLEKFYLEKLERVIYEMPEVWNSSAKGNYAKNSGALEKLYFICGAIHAAYGNKVDFYTAQEWKGQVPKSVTIDRVKSRYNVASNISDHEADAISIAETWMHKHGRVIIYKKV